MKKTTGKMLLAVLVLAIAACAGADASRKESLLTAAGFTVRTPQTEKQKEMYAAAPSYKVERITANNKTFYAYKDEKKGIAYVGDEAAYQRYQQLAIQQNIAEANYQAAQMNQQMAMGWYGAYGPYYAPPVVMIRR